MIFDVACSVGAELAALAPQRVLETAGEEPEGQEPEPPRGSRQAVGRQWLVVLRHGQRIDEARSPSVIERCLSESGAREPKFSGCYHFTGRCRCSSGHTHSFNPAHEPSLPHVQHAYSLPVSKPLSSAVLGVCVGNISLASHLLPWRFANTD
jgi:hypothetical protein